MIILSLFYSYFIAIYSNNRPLYEQFFGEGRSAYSVGTLINILSSMGGPYSAGALFWKGALIQSFTVMERKIDLLLGVPLKSKLVWSAHVDVVCIDAQQNYIS